MNLSIGIIALTLSGIAAIVSLMAASVSVIAYRSNSKERRETALHILDSLSKRVRRMHHHA